MSTFSGKIQEIPEISVDRFNEDNLYSEAFFLSHCHTDHMKGLCNYFFQTLIENDKCFYASQISCIILKRMYPCISSCLRELDLYLPTNIILKNKTILVTCLPAGHCPGSIMFLFECDKRILYTGDYRIGKNDIKKFRAFYDSLNQVKKIDKIYLDSTFFQSSYPKFPTRDESLQELCRLIENVTQQGPNYIVNLMTSAFYGYEHCFKEIFARTQCAIHVSQRAYEVYSLIPEMDKCVTLDGSTTQLHSNCGDAFKSICIFGFDNIIYPIKISAFRWRMGDLEEGISFFENGIYFVCYSTHASLEESTELITFLKPKEIELCVEYENPYIDKDMKELLIKLLNNVNDKSQNSLEKKPSFDSTKMTKRKKLKKSESCDDLGILNSPPRTRKSVESLYSIELERKTNDSELKEKFSQQINLYFGKNEIKKTYKNTSCGNLEHNSEKQDDDNKRPLVRYNSAKDILSELLGLTQKNQGPKVFHNERDLSLEKIEALPVICGNIEENQILQAIPNCEIENAHGDMLNSSQSSEENVLLGIINAPAARTTVSTEEIIHSNEEFHSSILRQIIDSNPS